MVVDYYSRYPEIVKKSSTTSTSTITALKTISFRYGIPVIVRSDNGPQYRSQEFTTFAKAYNFTHVTSSPLYPQSNGQVERTVQTLKKILRHADDICQGLLSYRTTPMPWCNLSPSELLMGRRLRSLLPMTDNLLIPQWPYLSEFHKSNEQFNAKQKKDFDQRHHTKEHSPLPDDREVWVTSSREPVRGRVVTVADTPRSYLVNTPSGTIRRNQQHLQRLPESDNPAVSSSSPESTEGINSPLPPNNSELTKGDSSPLLSNDDAILLTRSGGSRVQT